MNNYVCDRCGAMLDPGERCDCINKIIDAAEKWRSITHTNRANRQIEFTFKELVKDD